MSVIPKSYNQDDPNAALRASQATVDSQFCLLGPDSWPQIVLGLPEIKEVRGCPIYNNCSIKA